MVQWSGLPSYGTVEWSDSFCLSFCECHPPKSNMAKMENPPFCQEIHQLIHDGSSVVMLSFRVFPVYLFHLRNIFVFASVDSKKEMLVCSHLTMEMCISWSLEMTCWKFLGLHHGGGECHSPRSCGFQFFEKKHAKKIKLCLWLPLPETNIAPGNWWLEDDFPFEMVPFHILNFSHENSYERSWCQSCVPWPPQNKWHLSFPCCL